MSNVQQPEMRRSGHDPLVTDSAAERAGPKSRKGGGQRKDLRPADQRSPYGPEPETAPEARGGS